METIAAGRWYPDGTAGLVIFIIAIAVIVAMVFYGRSRRSR
ncbi:MULTISPECIES: hypothetical protein [unclassified Streptomyces]|nr:MULTISPECIES: hypothetical protein [unclassified Streptomyces]